MHRNRNKLINILSLFNETFDLDTFDFNDKYYDDQEVLDCQINLYLFLICDDEKEKERLFKKAEDSYFKLSKEKQEYVKQDIMHIFEEQEKNKEKEKILWEKQ